MVGAMSADEYRWLSHWFWREGESVRGNPWHLYGEDGRLMDFIDAMRTVEDMAANPQDYNMPKLGGAPDWDRVLEWDGAGEPPF